jgi:hypothetical protein
LGVRLTDFADNEGSSYGIVSGGKWVYFETIEVSNAIVDSERPVLKSFTALSSRMVDVTKGPASIDFQVVALDALSGVTSVSIMVAGPGQIYELSNQTEVKFDEPVVGQPVNVTISVVIGTSFRSGDYSINLSIQDDAFNTVGLVTKDLVALGFPGTVSVVSSK